MITSQQALTPSSVVIVKHHKGYVAHVRFANSKHDIDLSSKNKYYLYELVEGYVEKINL
jgi:hypothetical protein